ncbi:MAG: hypothetical protein ACI4QA_05965 [Candidatus Spyradosoma sp.]
MKEKPTRYITIVLTNVVARHLQAMVDSGEFDSFGAVAREAIAFWLREKRSVCLDEKETKITHGQRLDLESKKRRTRKAS